MQAGLPVFTLPFALSTLLILLSWQEKWKSKKAKTGLKGYDMEQIRKKKMDLMSSFADTRNMASKQYVTNGATGQGIANLGNILIGKTAETAEINTDPCL